VLTPWDEDLKYTFKVPAVKRPLLHGLFCELDTDKSRSLAAAELPRAFNALLEESKKREQAEPLLAAAAAEARKITERGQQAALTLAQSAMEAVAGASLETEQAVE
jgi:hypothetical protein